MSFVCGFCNTAQPNGETPTKVVTETRPKNYPERKYRYKGKTINDPGGQGREIVREALSCKPCTQTGTQEDNHGDS